MHYTIGCKYAYAICFEDTDLKPWMVCRKCVKYFRLERVVRELGILGIWDYSKPFGTPVNLLDHRLHYGLEVYYAMPQSDVRNS